MRSYFFLFVPPYNLGEGLLNLSRAYYVNNVQVTLTEKREPQLF